MTRYVFLDTETTGLDPARHSVWEVAWAVDEGPVQAHRLPHNVEGADYGALAVNGYMTRHVGQPLDLATALPAEAALHVVLDGATLVAANPAFDAAFLRARWGVSPWKYRLLDVEAYAMGALGLDEPAGLARIASLLRARSYSIDTPDHTAAGDVTVLRQCFYALRDLYKGARS